MSTDKDQILQFNALFESCLLAKKIDNGKRASVPCSLITTNSSEELAQIIEIYNLGIQIVRANVFDLTLCESILYKLLFLFPDCAEFYYFMATILITNRPNEIHRAG